MEADRITVMVAEALRLSQAGERAAARDLLERLWDELSPHGDPLHRCTVAHWMADLQEDARVELTWDLRALRVATRITQERLVLAGVAGPPAQLGASLHLNLGDVYRRLGEWEQSERHMRLARDAARLLGADGCATMIRGGVSRLAGRLGHEPDGGAVRFPDG